MLLQSQSAWFLPWLAQQSAELCFGVGFFLVYSVTGVDFSAADILFALCLFCLAAFCLYAVFSHYILLRRMKKHTTAIINSVMDSEYTYPSDPCAHILRIIRT